jgi:hypothetical protein
MEAAQSHLLADYRRELEQTALATHLRPAARPVPQASPLGYTWALVLGRLHGADEGRQMAGAGVRGVGRLRPRSPGRSAVMGRPPGYFFARVL